MTTTDRAVPSSYAPATVALFRWFSKWEYGEEHAYAEAADCCGHDVRPGSPHYGCLRTAVRVARRDYGVVIATIARIGFCRPRPPEHAMMLGRERRLINRKAGRSVEIAESLELERLDLEDRNRAIASICHLRLIQHSTAPGSFRSIRRLALASTPPVTELLRMMKDE